MQVAPVLPRSWIMGLCGGLLDLLCPPRCHVCGARPDSAGPAFGGLCADCLDRMPELPGAHCIRCGRPFGAAHGPPHACGWCQKKPPPWERALAAGLYQDNLRKSIHQFKYGRKSSLAEPLAGFMAQRLSPPFYPPEADLIVPVPLYPDRLGQRGFNQALLLARALYRPWSDRIHASLLVRNRATAPQITLRGEARRRNVRRAFTVTRPERVRGRSVILMDDVYTTGATMTECTWELRKAGVDRVFALTLARVP